MCGRYDLTESPQMLMLYFALSVEPDAYSNGDVRPTNTAPIIRDVDGQRIAGMARWIDTIVAEEPRPSAQHLQ